MPSPLALGPLLGYFIHKVSIKKERGIAVFSGD